MRPVRLGVGHALDPVHAALELEPREDAAALDLGDDLLVAAGRALAFGDDLDPPALELGVARIHAEEVAGEERGLVAARAGADLEDGALLVRLVLRQEQDAQVLRRPLERLLGARAARPRRARASPRRSPGSAMQRLEPVEVVLARPGRRGSPPTTGSSSASSRDRATKVSGSGPAFRVAMTMSWRARMASRRSVGRGDGHGQIGIPCRLGEGGELGRSDVRRSPERSSSSTRSARDLRPRRASGASP